MIPAFVYSEEPSDKSAEKSSDKSGEVNEELNIDELRKRILGEPPSEIMDFSLGDSEVSLFMTGSWMGSLQGNAGFSRSVLGTKFVSPQTPLLFTQEADLTMSLWMNKRWFVEAAFLDDYEKNTYRAGYQGLPGEFIQYAGVGNTGLDFPSFPYLDLGGDSPSSFGFYGRMGSGGFDVHTLLRYDAASRDEKVFLGGRERTFSYVDLSNSVRGVSFVLPDMNIDSEIIVYIEDENGSLRDSGGRRWRLAVASEYAAGKTQGLLELNIRPEGMVAVSYSKGADNRPWNLSMGSYSGSSGFLSEVQKCFKVSLDNYPMPGSINTSSGEVFINGNYALVIREPGKFSPFERQNRYESPSSMSEEAALVRLSSGTTISGYQLVPLVVSAASADIPLYVAAVSKRNIYELLSAKSGLTQRSPEACWPLALEYPEVYLPGAQAFSGDAGLKFTNFGGAGSFQIGTDVVPGSIQVWRSGIMDTNFSFNPSSGEVTLRGPTGANELIRITYLKRSEETRLGSIASGIGVIYQKEKSPFSAQAAVGVRWNVTGSSFTEEGSSSPGTVGLSAKTAWDYDNLKAQITAGFALDQNDTTGLYRAAGMEGHETVLPLPPETSFISNPPESSIVSGLLFSNRANLIYRNYYNNKVTGSTLMSVDWNGANFIQGLNKPYPVKDPELTSTQSLAMEFTLNDTEKWTGFQVPLGYNADIISRAAEIEIPFRLYGFDPNTANIKLIVQIGSLSGNDFAYNENQSLIWEKELFPDGDPLDNRLRGRIPFSITEAERLKLADAKYLRVIAVYNDTGGNIKGVVVLSPPIIRGAAFRPVTYEENTNTISGIGDFILTSNMVTALETVDGSLEAVYGDIIKKLHSVNGTQRVLKIDWKNMKKGISAGIDGRIGELPLANYRSLSFFVKGPADNAGTLSFIAASGPESIRQPQLEARIPLSAFKAGQWSKVTIRYTGNNTGISVDGADVGIKPRYTPRGLRDDKLEGKSGYVAVLINPEQSGTETLVDGSISIDEIILEDPAMTYRINAGTAFEYKKSGTLLSLNETQVLSDFLISTSVESEFRTDPVNSELDTAGSMAHRTGAEISVLGAKLYGKLFYTLSKDDFLWSAEHGISREWDMFSVQETFYFSPLDNNAKHDFQAGYSSLFYSKIETSANYDYFGLERKWTLGLGYKPERDIFPSVDIKGSAAWIEDEKIEGNENYAGIWTRTWGQMIPDSGKDANNRKTSAKIILTEGTKPVGAVFTLEGNTNSTKINTVTNLEHSAFLDISVSLNKTRYNFRAGRAFKKQINFWGSDASQDSEKFFESINDFIPLWKTIPGYSLFAYDINEAMDKSRNNSPSFDITQYMAFNDHFSVNGNFPSMYNLAALIVPSGVSLRLERLLEQKLDTRSDMLNLAGSLSFSAVNMFGAFGYLPLFKFYKSDEFTHAVQAAVIFPRNEDVSWRVQSVLGMSFRGFEDGALNCTNTLTLRSKGLWLESAVVDLTIPVKKSLLGVFYDWVAAKAVKQKSWLNLSALLSSDYEHFRKESLELAVEQTEDNLRVMCSVGHEAVIRILGRLSFSGFIKLRFSDETKTETFTVDGLLGTSLKVSF